MSVKGKVVWITASASGIGKATAKCFAREGAKLAICDINEEDLRKATRELEEYGAEVLAVPYDAGNTASIDQVFSSLIERYQTVDVLVNNAGIAGPTQPLIETSVEDWDKTLEVNLRGTFYCIKLVAPYMILNNGGKIVNLSSQSGKKPLANRSPYCASKMGVIGLTRVAAEELGKYGITVNAVCPGAVSGSRLDCVFEKFASGKGLSVEAVKKDYFSATPLLRAVPPQDIGELILFLSDNEKSNSITGEEVNINCGTAMF